MNRGFWAVFGSFVIWGLLPIYWHQLRQVPAMQIVAHRVVWCALLVVGYLTLRHGRGWLRETLRRPRVPLLLAISSVLISCNWGLYIWSVNHGHVVEASLGYFVNPLVNVMLGVLLLHERLNRVQWTAVGIAAAGVAYLTVQLGALPWIALWLAFSFGFYGLIRKVAAVEAIPGLGVESLYLVLPALAYLLFVQSNGSGVFGRLDLLHDAMLVVGGAITAVPLVWFAYGARRIAYSVVGLVQYVGPTLQLLIGAVLFGEPFSRVQACGYAIIWAALAIYTADGLLRARLRDAGAGLPVTEPE
ncbi:MAG: EamA family transporter RarD [Nevskia sp.]|nr:EamA family transporter RarD [Nevskia sp.]